MEAILNGLFEDFDGLSRSILADKALIEEQLDEDWYRPIAIWEKRKVAASKRFAALVEAQSNG